jgi:F0F1-type ATP synthase assembly protein I
VKDLWRVSPLLQLSWVIALATLLPLGAGILLDRLFHTAPLFILIGGLVGILAGTVGAVRITSRAIESLSPSQEYADPAEETLESEQFSKEDQA